MYPIAIQDTHTRICNVPEAWNFAGFCCWPVVFLIYDIENSLQGLVKMSFKFSFSSSENLRTLFSFSPS